MRKELIEIDVKEGTIKDYSDDSRRLFGFSVLA